MAIDGFGPPWRQLPSAVRAPSRLLTFARTLFRATEGEMLSQMQAEVHDTCSTDRGGRKVTGLPRRTGIRTPMARLPAQEEQCVAPQ
jgi:hypothetical protein